MATGEQSPVKMSRGLLTKEERRFLRGEKSDVDEQQYRYNVRSNFRQRLDELEDDIELLERAGEDDLVEEFFNKFGRVQRLEKELEELRDRVNEYE